jgi:hypothetical protein
MSSASRCRHREKPCSHAKSECRSALRRLSHYPGLHRQQESATGHRYKLIRPGRFIVERRESRQRAGPRHLGQTPPGGRSVWEARKLLRTVGPAMGLEKGQSSTLFALRCSGIPHTEEAESIALPQSIVYWGSHCRRLPAQRGFQSRRQSNRRYSGRPGCKEYRPGRNLAVDCTRQPGTVRRRCTARHWPVLDMAAARRPRMWPLAR